MKIDVKRRCTPPGDSGLPAQPSTPNVRVCGKASYCDCTPVLCLIIAIATRDGGRRLVVVGRIDVLTRVRARVEVVEQVLELLDLGVVQSVSPASEDGFEVVEVAMGTPSN